MKVKEVIAKIVGEYNIYPNGTNVYVNNSGAIYSTYCDAFKLLNFNKKEFNDPKNFCGV